MSMVNGCKNKVKLMNLAVKMYGQLYSLHASMSHCPAAELPPEGDKMGCRDHVLTPRTTREQVTVRDRNM